MVQVALLARMRLTLILKHAGDDFIRVRESKDLEHDYYFISQLYETDWRP